MKKVERTPYCLSLWSMYVHRAKKLYLRMYTILRTEWNVLGCVILYKNNLKS